MTITSNILLRRPKRTDMREELAHTTGASISFLKSNTILLSFKSKKTGFPRLMEVAQTGSKSL